MYQTRVKIDFHSLPYHLIFIAIFPVLSRYAYNIEQVAFVSTLRAYVIFPLAVLCSFAILFCIIRRLHYAALVISFGFMLFYAVVPLQSILIEAGLGNVGRIRYLLPFFVFIFILVVWVGRKNIQNPATVTIIFNFVAFFTLVLPLAQIGLYLIHTNALSDISEMSLLATKPNAVSENRASLLPDVYLIVLDTYARSDDIKSEFNYDNSQFLEQLTDTGFYIAQCSNANYPDGTVLSMFATLNMQYMEHAKIKKQSAFLTRSEWVDGIKQNEVFNEFIGFGYKTVTFNTRYDFLNFTDANVYYDFVRFPGTNIQYFNSFETLLIAQMPIGLQVNTKQRIHYENILWTLDKLPQIPQEVSSPKFVYSHILVPHGPYVFSPTGEYLADDQDEFTAQKYIDQVAFIDAQIVKVVKQIIENSSNPPIILIQGDHGFYSKSAGVRTSGILNAYYLPGINQSEYLYPTISPVNSFRLLFDLYFDGNMGLLPDDVYRDALGDGRNDDDLTPYNFSQYSVADGCLNGK